jgi:3-deoxy-7-phosphoheptulonate synthase
MSLILIHAGKKPVIRVGRFAGQYAKPRSKPTETRNGVTLPSYYGDLVNRPEFTAEARRADPQLLVAGYTHAALTLNFIRSLSAAGFADLHHPEYWDLSFFKRVGLHPLVREEYERTTRELSQALRFMEALGERAVDDLTRVDFFTSHEGLNLHYESAQTRAVPRRAGHYDLSVHLPWIGERTRSLDGAHVEFFRGIRNPVGVKVGPSASPDDILRLIARLNPNDEAGKLVLITRMGAEKVEAALPPLVKAVRAEGRRVLWISDPMHGNGITTASGLKTRDFESILLEIERTFDVHAGLGTILGGVHFELTGDDVTECVGGGITEADLDRNYLSVCDPRLNYAQALEMAFLVGRRLGGRTGLPPSVPPPSVAPPPLVTPKA